MIESYRAVLTAEALGLDVIVFVQVALATILLIGVNLYSAGCDIELPKLAFLTAAHLDRIHSNPHFARLDTTRDRSFTLPPELLEDLRQLQGETTIIGMRVPSPKKLTGWT